MNNLERVPLLPASPDAGLLILRLVGAGSLLLKHGFEKIFSFSAMAAHFPDPLHIGPVPSLLFAMVSDAVCSVLLLAGLATRWAALLSLVNLLIAWALVHHFMFFGHDADHGELIVLYLTIMAALLLAGPGHFSLDARLFGRRVKVAQPHAVPPSTPRRSAPAAARIAVRRPFRAMKGVHEVNEKGCYS